MRFEFDHEKDDANRGQARCLTLLWRARLRGRRLPSDPDVSRRGWRGSLQGDRDGRGKVVDGGACPSWRYGAFHFGQEKQRWRRKAVSCLRPTRATLKIFRSTVRRWTVPTWGGGSGVCGTASASPRRALPGDTASR